MERVSADQWHVIGMDDTGGFIDVDWTCPHCDFHNGKILYVDAEQAQMIKREGGFEYDQQCEWCNETVTIEC